MDLTSYNTYFREQDTDAQRAIFREPLTPGAHTDFDKHLIGETMGSPSIVSGVGGNSLGTSPIPAREDHSHSGGIQDGTAGNPGIYFENDANTGIFRPFTDSLAVSVGGFGVGRFDFSGLTVQGVNSETITIGRYSGDNTYAAVEAANGYLLLSKASDQHVYLRTSGAAKDLILGVNNTNKMVFKNSGAHTLDGNLTISGKAYALDWFRVYGVTGIYNETYGSGIYWTDSWVRSYNANGFYSGDRIGYASTAATGSMTGYSTVVRDAAFGVLAIFTSSRKLKEEITPLSSVGSIIDQFKPCSFLMKSNEDDEDWLKEFRKKDLQYGFIAEEVAEVDQGQFATYDENLEPQAWNLYPVVSVLMAEVQDLRKRVKELEHGHK